MTHDELRRLAHAAPWSEWFDKGEDINYEYLAMLFFDDCVDGPQECENAAKFIHAASPKYIIKLLDEIESLKSQLSKQALQDLTEQAQELDMGYGKPVHSDVVLDKVRDDALEEAALFLDKETTGLRLISDQIRAMKGK